MIDRKRVTRAFDDYVSAYNADDPKIRLKIDHTYRVAALCERIAAGSDDRKIVDPDLIWLCGMLHDIGRFEQIRRYNTFVDAASVDHAALGADLLFREGLLERFASELPEHDRQILECSIRSHSLYRLPEGLTEKEQIYCNILRDADKVDIFRVNCDTPPEEIYNVTTEALKTSSVSEEVKGCFLQHTAVLRSLKKTAVDYLVAHLCLVFELVYPVSRRIAREQGYVEQMLAFESENPDTQAWFRYMRENIWAESE